jgi:site-specific DNA recombinase
LGSWKWEQKPEDEWGVIEVEPIVSESIWHECNEILDAYEKSKKPPGRRPVQLFAGLAFCACGQKMYVKQNSPKYVCQKCLNKIPIVDLEAVVLEDLKAYFTASQRIAEHIQAANENLTEKEALVQTHQNEIQKVRAEMNRTHRLYVDGHVTPQGFGEFYKPAEERLNQLTAELPALEAEIAHMKVSTVSAEEVLSEARNLYSSWPKLPIENRRAIVESIIEKVTIGKDEIDIKLSHLPTSEELVKSQQALRCRSEPVHRR